jgi:hypothetical protein
MGQLILNRDPVGQNPEDYSILENGVIVGRIFKVPMAPAGPWMWVSGHNGDIRRADTAADSGNRVQCGAIPGPAFGQRSETMPALGLPARWRRGSPSRSLELRRLLGGAPRMEDQRPSQSFAAASPTTSTRPPGSPKRVLTIGSAGLDGKIGFGGRTGFGGSWTAGSWDRCSVAVAMPGGKSRDMAMAFLQSLLRE